VGQRRRSFENAEEEIRFHGGHAGEVTALCHLEGRRVVSASRDGTLRVWDLASGKTVYVLGDPGPRLPIAGIAALGGYRVVAATRQALRVWNAELGTVLRNFRLPYRGAVVGLSAIDDHRFFVANWDGILRLWDDRQGSPLCVFGNPEGRLAAAVTLDRRHILTGSESAVLQVWDLESEKCLHTLKDGRGAIGAVAALDPSRAVSGSDDGTVCVWDVDREKSLAILKGHEAAVKALAVIDARRLISGSADHTIRVWDVEAGQALDLFTLDAPVTALLVQPDRRTVVAGDSRGAVHFFILEEPNF
jgi:WD40 repeat protein